VLDVQLILVEIRYFLLGTGPDLLGLAGVFPAVGQHRPEPFVPIMGTAHEFQAARLEIGIGQGQPDRADLLSLERPVRQVLVPEKLLRCIRFLDEYVVEIDTRAARPHGLGGQFSHP